MARDMNWWLMSLAFLLGLLLTLALTIRKVTREVPVNRAVEVPTPRVDTKTEVDKVAGAVAAAGAGAAAKLHSAAEKVETKVERAKADVEHKVARVEDKNTAAFEQAEHVLEREPYGAGSIRVTARTSAPAGYTIKGDKDTGRYFTLESPEYESIEAEVWFANDESAEKAGFVRWNAAEGHRLGLLSTDAATVITEEHSTGDATLVVVDDGVAETKIVIVDDGIPDTTIRIIGSD